MNDVNNSKQRRKYFSFSPENFALAKLSEKFRFCVEISKKNFFETSKGKKNFRFKRKKKTQFVSLSTFRFASLARPLGKRKRERKKTRTEFFSKHLKKSEFFFQSFKIFFSPFLFSSKNDDKTNNTHTHSVYA